MKNQLTPISAIPVRSRRTIVRLHALSGMALASFTALHLYNQFLVLLNPGDALALMETLRRVYRWAPVEALLIACVICQIATGPALAHSLAKAPGNNPARLTRASGYYLLLFLAIHIGAVFWGRLAMHLDTNIYFAAAGLHSWPHVVFFAPYYFLAVVAVFVHLGQAAARRSSEGTRWRVVALATGTVAAGLILAGMFGIGNQMVIPDEYMQTYLQSGETP